MSPVAAGLCGEGKAAFKGRGDSDPAELARPAQDALCLCQSQPICVLHVALDRTSVSPYQGVGTPFLCLRMGQFVPLQSPSPWLRVSVCAMVGQRRCVGVAESPQARDALWDPGF